MEHKKNDKRFGILKNSYAIPSKVLFTMKKSKIFDYFIVND